MRPVIGLAVWFVTIATVPVGAQGEGRIALGLDECDRCHKQQENRPPAERDWVLMSEVSVSLVRDEHVKAYAVLFNERSREMGRRLKTEVHRDARCLTCHTGYPTYQMEVDHQGLAGVDVDTFNGGVSCEGCHGPSGNSPSGDPGWRDKHEDVSRPDRGDELTWRFFDPKKKTEDYGFIDVRSPASRARICLSCHLGDVEAGRVVTHQMYAAGHPPLPAFEMENFVQQMPAHWRSLGEKDKKLVDEFLRWTEDPLLSGYAGQEDYVRQNMDRTESMLVGGLVSFSENLRLVSELANETVSFPAGIEKPAWPDLTTFDCYACHHELRYPGWRQARGYKTLPGRPTLRTWPVALVRLIAQKEGTEETLDGHLEAISKVLSRRPFGEPRALHQACEEAARWADDLADELQQRRVTRQQAEDWRLRIADFCAHQTLDYDSARQLLWAFLVVDRELRPVASVASGSTSPRPLIESYRATALEASMRELRKLLALDLREGHPAPWPKTAPVPEGEERRPAKTIREVDLGTTLPKIDAYRPSLFKAQFKEIRRLIGM